MNTMCFRFKRFNAFHYENLERLFKGYSTDSLSKKEIMRTRQSELMSKGLPKRKPIDNVKKIILVSSGKGGVGKSTTSVNLAASMKQINPDKNIGLLDSDVFGPSIPLMMNLNDSPLLNDRNLMVPLLNYGIQCMSMGFLIKEGAPVIWRGLMVMQALDKLLRQVAWNSVDYLIIDTPPGTGDAHLSLVQNIPISGVLLVTTPHKAAIQVTQRGAEMYRKLNVPIIGIIENMSSIKCPECSKNIQIFGDRTKDLASDLKSEILAKIPLNQSISDGSDSGVPIVISTPDCDDSRSYLKLAKTVVGVLGCSNQEKF